MTDKGKPIAEIGGKTYRAEDVDQFHAARIRELEAERDQLQSDVAHLTATVEALQAAMPPAPNVLQRRMAQRRDRIARDRQMRAEGVRMAAEACEAVATNYSVMNPGGETHAPLRVQKAAKSMVRLAADDIRAMDATERRGEHIVTQSNGKPVGYTLAWRDFMATRRQVGAEACNIHALRHTAAAEIASLPGMTKEHVKAITGHSSDEMARHYSGAAAQIARATGHGRQRLQNRN